MADPFFMSVNAATATHWHAVAHDRWGRVLGEGFGKNPLQAIDTAKRSAAIFVSRLPSNREASSEIPIPLTVEWSERK